MKTRTLIIIAIILAFLWFEVRPSAIRRICQNTTRESGVNYFQSEGLRGFSPTEKEHLQAEYMNGLYNRCLHDKGLAE